MAGIYGVLQAQKSLELDEKISNYFYTSSFEHSINEDFEYKGFLFGRSVINKFANDRTLYEDEKFIISFEGVFYNKEDDKSYETIIKWYQKYAGKFVEKIKGQFCGFIYDKHLDSLVLFNDHLSSKPLYIYKSKTLFIFASELKVITKLLTHIGIKKELDYDAVYSMLTFGYMLDNLTLEKHTKKLPYATLLEVNSNFSYQENQYFKYDKIENLDLTKNEIIEKIDNLLVQSVKDCWQKDKEYGYKHYAFLSGGLDSRVNVFLAKEEGFKDIETITFSQEGSSDECIAKEISHKEFFTHQFFPLKNGEFLENDLMKFVLGNDGLTVFSGAAAPQNIMSSLKHDDFGALHTGQIGDLLFGSYAKSFFDTKSALMSNQQKHLKNISIYPFLKEKYENKAELFGYEQRVINCTLNGDRALSHFTDTLSPFYNRDLISFCLSIPDRYKKDEAIYLDWFNLKHRSITNYKWESAGVKPKNIRLVVLAKIFKRYKNALLRRLSFNINDMNPFDIWFRKNKKILENFDKVFTKYNDALKDTSLKEDLKNMYMNDVKYSHYGRNNKLLVLTLLLSISLHFDEINNEH